MPLVAKRLGPLKFSKKIGLSVQNLHPFLSTQHLFRVFVTNFCNLALTELDKLFLANAIRKILTSAQECASLASTPLLVSKDHS